MLVMQQLKKQRHPSIPPTSKSLYLYLISLAHNSEERNPHWVTKAHFSFPNIIPCHKCHILVSYCTWDQELKHNEYEEASSWATFLLHPQSLNWLVRNLNTYLSTMEYLWAAVLPFLKQNKATVLTSLIPRAPSLNKTTAVTKEKTLKLTLYFRAVLHQTIGSVIIPDSQVLLPKMGNICHLLTTVINTSNFI